MLLRIKREYLIVFLIFIFGFVIRLYSVLPYNTEIGFDQARDLFSATTIFRDHHLAVIGPTAGNNSNLHHGVAFLYYMILPLILGKGNPMAVVIFNSFINALTIIVIYFFGKSLFESKRAGIVASFLTAISYQIVQYAGWVSNPTVTIFTATVFFYSLWKYYKGNKNFLMIAMFFLGLTIEFELFFVYLIPVFIILFFVLRMKFPSIKIFLLSVFLFCLATSTMIATEVKLHFVGIMSIFSANKYISNGSQKINFLTDWKIYADNFSPGVLQIGIVIGIAIVLFLIIDFFVNIKKRNERNKILFLSIYFLSSAIMLLIGASNEPWFFIGRPIAIILCITYLILKIKSKFLITSILFLLWF